MADGHTGREQQGREVLEVGRGAHTKGGEWRSSWHLPSELACAWAVPREEEMALWSPIPACWPLLALPSAAPLGGPVRKDYEELTICSSAVV